MLNGSRPPKESRQHPVIGQSCFLHKVYYKE